MNKKEANARASLIILTIIGISILIIKIQIEIIHFHQKMFWWALVFSFIFLLASLIFLIWGIFKRDEENSWGYYSESGFFTCSIIFLFAGVLLILALISFFVIMPKQYNKGYSDEALQRLAELEGQSQSLQQIQSVLNGQIVWDIQNQVLDETITNLCKDPNYPCDTVKQSYQIYKEIKGYRDDAESIMNYFGFIKKIQRNNLL